MCQAGYLRIEPQPSLTLLLRHLQLPFFIVTDMCYIDLATKRSKNFVLDCINNICELSNLPLKLAIGRFKLYIDLLDIYLVDNVQTVDMPWFVQGGASSALG